MFYLKRALPALCMLLSVAGCGSSSPLVTGSVGAVQPRGTCATADEPYVARNDLVDATPGPGTRLLRFVQISDEHILDDDGHAVVGLSALDPVLPLFESAMRFQDEYTDEVLNRMIDTLNGCHADDPIELVVATGDNTDLATVGEVRRLIDNLDGTHDRVSRFEQDCRVGFPDGTAEAILDLACTRLTGRGVADTQTPDPDPDSPLFQLLPSRAVLQTTQTEAAVLSGRDADGNVDPSRSTLVRAPGLPEVLRCDAGTPGCDNLQLQVPYYVVFGNHDGYLRGTIATQPGVVEAYAVAGRGLLDNPRQFIGEFFETSAFPGPIGHGFNHVEPARFNDDNDRNNGYYAFNTVDGQVRMIIANTIVDGSDPELPLGLRNPFALSDGSLDVAQFEWLQQQLADSRARGQLAMLFSHHPDLSFVEFGIFGALAPGGVAAATLNAELASWPHFVAWIAGHTHRHRIRAFKVTEGIGDNGSINTPVICKEPDACHGFWQVETTSLIDHPQEARILEVFDHGGGIGSLRTTVLQHDFERSKALAERDDRCQLYLTDPASVAQLVSDADLSALCLQGGTRPGEAQDRNTELMFHLPPAS